VELFCQTVYQNSFSFTGEAGREVETKIKAASHVP
jgi:hypothetical protein